MERGIQVLCELTNTDRKKKGFVMKRERERERFRKSERERRGDAEGCFWAFGRRGRKQQKYDDSERRGGTRSKSNSKGKSKPQK